MKLAGLEGLRGIMCVWVVLSHTVTIAALPIYKNSGIGRLLANGTFAVDVFIMLSGFVVALLITKKSETYFKYISRRAMRLFPVYVVCLVISIMVLQLSVDFLTNANWVHPKYLNRLQIFEDTNNHLYLHSILHFFLAHGMISDSILPNTAFAIMGQAWSLTLEWQFYIIAPFLLWLLNSKKFLLFFASAVILIFLQPNFQEMFGHRSFILANIALFLVGIVSFKFFESLQSGKDSPLVFTMKFAFILLLTASFQYYHFGILSIVPLIIWFLSLTSEVTTNNNLILKLTKLVNNARFSLFLGKISYSIYCIHMVWLYVVGWFFTVYFPVQHHALFAILTIGVSFSATVLSSVLLNRYIEQPFISLGRKI
jgi:peptidoglycan/LPS O-acetylase OafA/YrhL